MLTLAKKSRDPGREIGSGCNIGHQEGNNPVMIVLPLLPAAACQPAPAPASAANDAGLETAPAPTSEAPRGGRSGCCTQKGREERCHEAGGTRVWSVVNPCLARSKACRALPMPAVLADTGQARTTRPYGSSPLQPILVPPVHVGHPQRLHRAGGGSRRMHVSRVEAGTPLLVLLQRRPGHAGRAPHAAASRVHCTTHRLHCACLLACRPAPWPSYAPASPR